jgi:hypothetical protein
MAAGPSGVARCTYQPSDFAIAIHCTKSPREVVSVSVFNKNSKKREYVIVIAQQTMVHASING